MGKVTRSALHLSLEEIKGKLRTSIDFCSRQQWSVIYTALVAPRPAAALALHLGVSVPFVHKMISLYKRFGPAALETPGSGGRRNQSLTIEEEQPFVAPCLQRAAAGEVWRNAAGADAKGNFSVNVVPLPTTLSTRMRPR